ncbi:hypothetical protein QL285_005026 [Trifolium repens]|nr:hypothetical protein QL285_005026 [Trifolium repens]
MMFLNNETWSLSWFSFHIRELWSKHSETTSPPLLTMAQLIDMSNGIIITICVILNVDESCLGSPIRSGFVGSIIRNTSATILQTFHALFKGHLIFCLRNCMISTRVSCWPKI